MPVFHHLHGDNSALVEHRGYLYINNRIRTIIRTIRMIRMMKMMRMTILSLSEFRKGRRSSKLESVTL